MTPLTLGERLELSSVLATFRSADPLTHNDWDAVRLCVEQIMDDREQHRLALVEAQEEADLKLQHATELARYPCRCRELVGDQEDCPVHGVVEQTDVLPFIRRSEK